MTARIYHFKPYYEQKVLETKRNDLSKRRINLLTKERELFDQWELVKRNGEPTVELDGELEVTRAAIRNLSISIHDIDRALDGEVG